MKNALLKIAISYLTGLILGYFFLYSIAPFLALVIASSAFSILLMRRWKARPGTILLYTLPLLAGAGLINLHSYPVFPLNHVVHYAKRSPMAPTDLKGVITRPVETRNDYSVLYLRAEALKLNDQMVPGVGNIRVNVSGSHQELSYGDRVLLKGVRLRLPRGYWNPGGFNYPAFMARRGIYATASLWKDGDIKVITKGEGNGFLSLLYSFKERSASAIDKNLPRRQGGILKAMILGDTGGVYQTDRRNFARSGTAHLLAISGLHVGFVALASYYIILLFLKGALLAMVTLGKATFHAKRWAALASIFPVAAYATMVGDKPSATRAAIMVITYLGARFIGRDKNLYNALALAALIILIWKPLSILETGFQLSFLAAFFIVYYIQRAQIDFGAASPTLRGVKLLSPPAWKTRIAAYVIISIIATLATAPVIARVFNEVSLNGPAVNVLAIPLSSVLIPAGLLASAVNMVSEAVARPLFAFSSLLTYILSETSSLFASVSPFSFRVLTPWLPAAVAYYFLLAGAMSCWRRRYFRVFLAGTAAAMALSVSVPYLRSHVDGMLRVTFLDVGEGDAAVVQFPRGKVMVVDAGPAFRSGRDTGEIVLAPYLRSKGIRRIDYLLISHAQVDHAGGARSLLQQFDVRRLWENGSELERYLHEQVEALDRASPIERVVVKDNLSPFYIDGVKVEILNPSARYTRRRSENNRSVVMRLTYGDFSALFPGDIERPVQKTLSMRGEELNATILKVPHHGASSALHVPFVSAVAPEVAVISAGKYNRFGHPHPLTLSAYHGKGIKTYSTDRNGAVSIVSDGHVYSVKTFTQSLRPNDIRRILNH